MALQEIFLTGFGTFLEGLLSFVSPCLLPMLPVYLIYFAGDSAKTDRGGSRVLVNAVAFTLGFTLVFVLLGVFAGTLGTVLAEHRRMVSLVAGLMTEVFGLSFLGVFRLPFTGSQDAVSGAAKRVTGPLSAFLFGTVFALCLTPCVGAFLGAALMTAANEGGALKGALLLFLYSQGLAVPFIVSAVMIDRLRGLFTFFKAHGRGVSVVSGVLLIILGAWMAVRGYLFRLETDAPAADAPAAVDGVSSAENENKKEVVMEVVLNAANFEAEVIKCDRPVIVDFWAPWCGPCRMLAPELAALAAEKGETVKVGKVNVDENPELCARYGITSIPAIFVFKNGTIANRGVGFMKKEALAALLN